MSEYNRLINMNLQFFAKDESGEKTEEPTQKKKDDARQEGQVVKSTEIVTAVILIGMFSFLRIFGGMIVDSLLDIMKITFNGIYIEEFTAETGRALYVFYFKKFIMILLPILGFAFLIAFVANIAQVGWKPTLKPLKPKFDKLNPISGIKRLFSLKTIVELIKSILKLTIIFSIVYMTLKDYQNLIYAFYDTEVVATYTYIAKVVLELAIKIGAYFIIIGAIDYFYIRYKNHKDLKMTKQEVKEESKQSEGNPEIKGKIRQKMREAAMRRMMSDLPKADVIITNPTHIAIAIKYEEESGRAPVVLAKGADLVAYKIREKAKEYSIEIVENKLLARALYYTVELGDEIPPELYQGVAEVLAFVYSLK